MATKSETPGQFKQRHKLELRQLQNDVKLLQKKGKKEKWSKSEMEQQVQKLESDVAERHKQELAALEEDNNADSDETATTPAAAAAVVEQAVAKPAAAAESSKKTKAQRRRVSGSVDDKMRMEPAVVISNRPFDVHQENKKKQEQEERERIEEANKNVVSERQIEADIILGKLRQHKLVIKDIPSDGHCMYHAVADQMKQHNMPIIADEPAYQYLRRITGEYIRARPDDYMPFLALDLDSGKSMEELFEEYCDRIVNTSDWGGQLELRALACALSAPIHVFSAESDVIPMGEEFTGREPLKLTYHLHYYTLGEHFNSVMPA